MRPTTDITFWKFHQALELLRTLDREFPMQLASILSWVAAHDGCDQEDISKALSMSTSSVSRNLQRLGPMNRFQKPGFMLLEQLQDTRPGRSKYKRIRLTTKGKQFLKSLKNALDPLTEEQRPQFDPGFQFYNDGRPDPITTDPDFKEFVKWFNESQ